MRASAAWIAGCVGGYIDTIRVAALHALANSARRPASSGESGSVDAWGAAITCPKERDDYPTSSSCHSRSTLPADGADRQECKRTGDDNPYDILPTAHASGGHHSRQARRRSPVSRGDRVLR